MVRPQFSLLQLVLLVGVVGIALAVVRLLSTMFGPWAFDVGLTPLILLTALLIAIFGRGTFRAYVIGFYLSGFVGFVGSFVLYYMLSEWINKRFEDAMIDDNDYRYHLLLLAILLVPTMVTGHVGGIAARQFWRIHLARRVAAAESAKPQSDIPAA